MGQSELAAHQRMELEAVLEDFENALRDATDGALPDPQGYLTGFHGEAREYLEREMQALSRDLVRGNYVVLNPIESGGMGSVSRVRHLRLGKVMALKEIRAEALQAGDRQELVRRFQREIEACGRLDDHPNVVSYTDTGVNELGAPFLVMDYIDGEDLGKIVRRVGPLRVADAAMAIHEAAVGLAHAHDHGLVHRDVKPSNIMISRHGTVKVLDFGLARITNTDRQLTALTTGRVMGTFDYMSPELCREVTPDLRGDIYSLGCTFYFALAGKAPFEESKSQFEKMNAHLHVEPPAIPRLDEHPDLRQILRKMTAKAPEQRYQDLHQVAEALEPFRVGADLRALVGSSKPRNARSTSASGGILLPVSRGRDSGRATDSNAGDQTAEWTVTRRKRVSRFWWTTALMAAGAALLISLLIADHWRRAADRRELTLVLGSLPGLNGRWWFEEAPWLLPEVRLAMAESLASSDERSRAQFHEALFDNPSAPRAYAQLELLEERFRREWPDEVTSRLFDVESYDPEFAEADAFSESLRSLATKLDSQPPASLTGAELHLRAVIYHHQEQLDAASRTYDAAVRRYGQEGQTALRSLCLLDWGELLHGFRKPALAHPKFRQAWKDLRDSLPRDESLPRLFELYAKVMEADAHRRIENLREAGALLEEAWAIAGTLPERHPLRAFVQERRGWLHLDNWRLAEARRDFEEALAIRESHEPENHRARHFIYWDKQGVAMARMYDGQTAAARQLFRELLNQIDEPHQGITKLQRRELEDRRPNLQERFADTALYQDEEASSEQSSGEPLDPTRELQEAIDSARRLGFERDGRKAILIRLQYKLAVVHAMRGDTEAAARLRDDASALTPAASESSSKAKTASGAINTATYELTQRLAEAALRWRSNDPDESELGRRQLTKEIAIAGTGLRRDDLLLLFYVAENLIQSESLKPSARVELAEQMKRLIRVQPFPRGTTSSSGAPGRAPGVFLKYWELAEEIARKE